jgi:hypothetical protein
LVVLYKSLAIMFEENTTWKGRLLRFVIYALVGFGCAFLYNYLKK